MHQQVYHSYDIQAWEQRWFAQQNSSYGLMQQVAWSITQRLIPLLKQRDISTITVCCGQGNNAGDGYLVAKYLKQNGFQVDLYAAELGESSDLQRAYLEAKEVDLPIFTGFDFQKSYGCIVDALFGIGLNRQLDEKWQDIIAKMNQHSALKVAIDIPSGLQANTGQPLPCAFKADFTFTVLGLKAGLFTGKAKEYSGEISAISLIPLDSEIHPIAQLTPLKIYLPKRQAFGHKGSYGHVLVVGGHEEMGGAVIMAAESAFAAGAGKVTVICHERHHVAILARAANIMLKDINSLSKEDVRTLLSQIDAVCFGMGLGRDEWAKQQYKMWFDLLINSDLDIVLDADALWFLAENPRKLNQKTYLTPHPGEAAKLLNSSVTDVESDRIKAIYELKNRYDGQWLLKGSGSLILENEKLWMCTAGNAGMGTGGMGDVLSGMIASLKAQLNEQIALHEIVTLHALAGDELAKEGMRGLQAFDMPKAIYKIINETL
ncbi:NAD(P)H-hydrate dehydratase [Acinetobacter portensis]|uniref:NAD(P)H-hydrate dehydratase n=1 Tax=Acinetobacter portensis TaxID=1839785 RepID=UPI0013D186C8|nr:NAD(P)H-hydrate dehydratase [Acinetobacter portensis]